MSKRSLVERVSRVLESSNWYDDDPVAFASSRTDLHLRDLRALTASVRILTAQLDTAKAREAWLAEHAPDICRVPLSYGRVALLLPGIPVVAYDSLDALITAEMQREKDHDATE